MLEGYEKITMPKGTPLYVVEARASSRYGGKWEAIKEGWGVFPHPKITFCFTWVVKRVSE